MSNEKSQEVKATTEKIDRKWLTKEAALEASRRNLARLQGTLSISELTASLETQASKEDTPHTSTAILLRALKEPNFYNVREAQWIVNNSRAQFQNIPRLAVDGVMGRNTLRGIQMLHQYLKERSTPLVQIVEEASGVTGTDLTKIPGKTDTWAPQSTNISSTPGIPASERAIPKIKIIAE